eukprot:553465-Hanusia_phi.AAC.1
MEEEAEGDHSPKDSVWPSVDMKDVFGGHPDVQTQGKHCEKTSTDTKRARESLPLFSVPSLAGMWRRSLGEEHEEKEKRGGYS